MIITSRSNARIKLAKQLQRRKGRVREQRWLVEGIRPLEEALRHRLFPETVFFTQDGSRDERVQLFFRQAAQQGAAIVEVTPLLMQEISEAKTPQGVVGIVPIPARTQNIWQQKHPFLLVIDRIQDPGNLGTICRSALATVVDGIVLLPGTVDVGHPKTIRASAGAVLGLKFLQLTDTELLEHLQRRAVRLITADIAGKQSLYDTNWHGALALLVGNEASGPAEKLVQATDELVRIPMPGPVESLNVATAAALCLFEAARQRVPSM